MAAAIGAVIFDQTIYNYFGYGLLPSVEQYPMRVITSDSISVYRGLPPDRLLADSYSGVTRDEIEAWKERVVKNTYGHHLHASSFFEKPVLEQTLVRDGYILEYYTMEGLLDDRMIFWKMIPNEAVAVGKAVMVIPGHTWNGSCIMGITMTSYLTADCEILKRSVCSQHRLLTNSTFTLCHMPGCIFPGSFFQFASCVELAPHNAQQMTRGHGHYESNRIADHEIGSVS